MGFACPTCQRPDSLRITHTLELPPDGRSDEITLQIVCCAHCGFRGTAVYEESRRAAADSWHHDGYETAEIHTNQLAQAISQCPQPGNIRCDCLAHKQYGKTDENGRWVFPFAAKGSFNMIWHKGGQ